LSDRDLAIGCGLLLLLLVIVVVVAALLGWQSVNEWLREHA